ncbi:MAG: hypothetical protein RL289_1111 [Actinomycetota bacterium]|jgi:aminoglycoside 2'-N-acetyltransferase I
MNIEIAVIPSSELTDSQKIALTELLHLAYEGDFSTEDFDHCLGGMHFLAEADSRLVGHGSVVHRKLWINGNLYSCGYLEAMGTHPELQRQGIGSQLLRSINDYIRGNFELGALSTDEFNFYGAQGWQRWEGPSFVLVDGELQRSADEDESIMVLNYDGPRDLSIAVEDRAGDPW